MSKYFANIYETVSTLLIGMRITFRHMMNIKRDNVTLQYPEERWPRPERNIGFEHKDYNVIRSRLHVDIDDCIEQAMEINKLISENNYLNAFPVQKWWQHE